MRRVVVSAAVLAVVGGGVTALDLPAARAASQPAPVCNATTCTTTYLETGAVQSFSVPSQITSLQATVLGARGGNALVQGTLVDDGGLGGESAGTIAVTPGDTLAVVVGGAGGDMDDHYEAPAPGQGGYGGGGSGGGESIVGGPGGGGGSFLFSHGGSLLLAAGGGGAAPDGAQNGATHAGGSGGGAGAAATAGGDGTDGAAGGTPGTPSANGTGGSGSTADADGFDGFESVVAPTALPEGGSGGSGNVPGGGGGGGYTAGGGGGADDTSNGSDTGAGGGGGAGFAASSGVTAVTGTAGAQNGNGEVTISYAKLTQPAVTVTSTAPTSPVVGQTYPVTATGGDTGTGNPVVLSIAASTAANCTISGSTVTFIHTGSCEIDANQAGDATTYQPAPTGTQTLTVGKAGTTTTAAVHPTTITATVAPSPAGAVTPTGSVSFSVGGKSVGSADLDSDGVATLTDTLPATAAQQVTAVYGGSDLFTGSQGAVTRKAPTVTATVSSPAAKTAFGWYPLPVTVSFDCKATTAPLVSGCPAAVTLTTSAANQSVKRTVQATDGGAATTSVTGINIDTVKPVVKISGVVSGHTYRRAPHLACKAHDALSGLAGACQLIQQRTTKHGVTTVSYVATAKDKAGNVTTKTGTYSVKK